MSLSAFTEEFHNPPSAYRGAPFWAWNGKLEPEELRRQVRLMHRMGLGGFFMHSRVGLDTAYLSKEWFQCIDACVDEAEKLEMRPWLYDEDRWPSGAAGGLVTKDEKYRMRALKAHRTKEPADLKWDKQTVAAALARFEGETMTGYEPLAHGKKAPKLEDDAVLIVFREEINPNSSWYNGYTYLDTMSHEAVKRFIQVTHEAYRKHLGKKLGTSVPGIFTDEPNHGPVMPGKPHPFVDAYGKEGNDPPVPWTAKLPEVFKERYGYDLLDCLPEVFFDLKDHPVNRVRYHYHDCKTHLFVDAFARQIGEWCEKAGIEHTGHVLAESPMRGQASVVGSPMRFYEYMQAPGMDLLRQYNREYDTARCVSSVARQFGRRWRLTETYGCTGWDFPFAGHKALGDWQAALGINLRAQHLAWYTMEGQAKRDYPAAIFYQSPWWEHYPHVEDYFGRVNVAMSRGVEIRHVLVVHPNESLWPLMRDGWTERPEVDRLDRQLIRLRDALLSANIDFDYGDEEILSRHAAVEKRSKKKNAKPELIVAQARYRAVVVPPALTLRRSTLNLLKRFSDLGGTVVFAGALPRYVDAEISIEAVALARQCLRTPLQAAKLADALGPEARAVSITNAQGKQIEPVLYQLRQEDDAMLLFVANTGHRFAQTCAGQTADIAVADRKAAFGDVRIQGFEGCNGAPLEYDLKTGEVYTAEAKVDGKGWEIRTSLPALGSRLFVVPRRKQRRKAPAKRTALKAARVQGMGGQWTYALSEANCLVLDRPRYRIGKSKKMQPADEILRIDHLVRDALGVQRRGGRMVQPWAVKKKKRPNKTEVCLEYEFRADAVPTGDLFLAIERPDTMCARINGEAVAMDADCGWWVDRSLRTVRIDPSTIRTGKNSLELTCRYDENHPGLEIVYLLGHFATKVKNTQVAIGELPERLDTGDWTEQGLAFYAGSVAYTRNVKTKLAKGQRLFVEVPEYQGVAVRIMANGHEAGVIAWEPNEVDITDYVEGDRTDLAIEVVGHRRNSHGPLHHAQKNPPWVGPGEYVTTDERWVDTYQLVSVGLMAPPRLVYKK